MIRNKHLLTLTLTLAASAALAQPPAGHAPTLGKRGPQGPPQGEHRPPPPLISALDADGDGIISAAEIDNAPEALKKLDKNHDGKLTMDELRPPRPPGDRQGPGGRGGARDSDGPRQGPRDGDKGGDKDAAPGDKPAEARNDNGKGGPQGDQRGGRRPAPPIIAALDTDQDGVISAEEISHAAVSLRTLDKNGDGQLTLDEYHPAPPKGDGQKGDGPKGPRGDRPKPPGKDGDKAAE